MIRLKNVFVRYKNAVPALTDFSLTVDQGEFVYLIGKSGSGKSTLLNLLYGKVKPTSGQVAVGRYFLNHLKVGHLHRLRRNIGVVFQDYQLLEYKTVYENIAYVLEVTGCHHSLIKERVIEVLEFVGLKHKALVFPSDCSGGEQQRIAIARAIVHKPEVLIADEPTGNLDPRTAVDMLNLLHKINKTGTTVIMATHDYSFVERVPSRVVEVEKGKLKRDRSKDHAILILNNKLGDTYVV